MKAKLNLPPRALRHLLPFFFVLFNFSLNAQTEEGADPLNNAAVSSSIMASEEMAKTATYLKRHTGIRSTQNPQPEAMWDVQFKFAQNDSVPLGSTPRVYGLVWTGNEFWGTPWNSAYAGAFMDSIYRYSATGRFLGVLRMKNSSVMRGMTLLNGAIWACNTADSIYKISLQTGEVIKKVKTATTGGNRFITADNTGKLWVGNFSTAISQIDTNGVVSQTIPASVHGMTGMSGAAFDNISPGGPYLWINSQTSQVVANPAGTYVRVLKINPSVPLTTERNVLMDAPDLGTSIAGSMSIAQMPGFSKPSLIVLSQNATATNTGRVVGYELSYTPPAVAEVGIDSARQTEGYTLIPRTYSNNLSFTAKLNNRGTITTPSDSKLFVDILQGPNVIVSRNVPLNVASFANHVVSISNFGNLGIADYSAFFLSSVTGDPLGANDSSRVLFSITDSTMGRDNMDRGQAFTSWGPGGGFPATPRRIGTTYTFPTRATINSVTMFYRSANINDTLHVAIFRMVNGRPTDSIAGSAPIVSRVDDNIGIRRTFPLRAPLTVNAGETILITSTDDGRGTHFVYSTTNILPTSSCWVYRQAYLSGTTSIPTGWYPDTVTVGAAVQRRGFMIRPNLNIRTDIDEPTGNIEALSLMPNPTSGQLHLSLKLETADKLRIDIVDIAGKLVHTEGVSTTENLEKDLSLYHLSNGFYFVKITTESGGRIVKRFVKQ
jgi:hypothetical protein